MQCSVCVSLGTIVCHKWLCVDSSINGMALHAHAKDKDMYCK